MSVRSRRIVASLVLGVLGAATVGGAVLGGMVGRPMHIDQYWARAVVRADGTAIVDEQIDYDFSSRNRHGILRNVPGLDGASAITVSSPDAPDTVAVTDNGAETELRIGNPDITVTGQHRYVIRYGLSTLTTDTGIAWNSLGTGWPVGVDHVEAHIVAPYAFTNERCVTGAVGDTHPCDVTQPEPGHLVANATNRGKHEGMTIYADRVAGSTVTPAATPQPPNEVPSNPGTSLLSIGLAALPVFLGMVVAARQILRAGRERVSGDSAADAAYVTDPNSIRRIDAAKLAAMAIIEFAPPKGLSPAQGGVLLNESVGNNQKAAWLMQANLDGYLDIDGDKKKPTLARNAEKVGPATYLLDQAFAGREAMTLGKYDKSFASAWKSIGTELESWRTSSGLWDPQGDRNCALARVVGSLVVLIAAVVGFAGGAAAGGGSSAWLVLVGVASLAIGAGLAAVVLSSELRVRTPQGSGLWLQAESFRRFLAQSEAKNVEWAADHNVLREYTAWAVALGEVSRWTNAMEHSSVEPERLGNPAFYLAAPYLASAASTASTSPSSSSSGGGSVGGGGGGGGGGSW